MSRHAVVVLALWCSGVLIPCAVRAQTRPADPETLIRKGNELRTQGRNEEALPFFQAAYAALRTPRTAGQLGLSEMTVGYWVEAERHLAEALEFPAHPWVARNGDGLRDMLRKARERIAEVVVDGSPAGAEVRVNGRPVGALPLASPLRIGEGRIEIDIVASHYKSETRSLSVKGGEKVKLTINLAPVVDQPAAAPVAAVLDSARSGSQPEKVTSPPWNVTATAPASTERPAEQRSKWPAVAAVSAGLLAVGFGTVELFKWRHAEVSFNDHLGPAPGAPSGSPAMYRHDCGEQDPMRGGPGCQAIYDDAARAHTFAIVGFAVGGALIATSAVLWLSGSDGSQERRVSFGFDPAGRRVDCRWRF